MIWFPFVVCDLSRSLKPHILILFFSSFLETDVWHLLELDEVLF